MDSAEDYARQWVKRKKGDRMGEECEVAYTDKNLKKTCAYMSSRTTSIFKNPNVAKHLSLLHYKYVIVCADKAPNIVLCVSHIT